MENDWKTQTITINGRETEIHHVKGTLYTDVMDPLHFCAVNRDKLSTETACEICVEFLEGDSLAPLMGALVRDAYYLLRHDNDSDLTIISGGHSELWCYEECARGKYWAVCPESGAVWTNDTPEAPNALSAVWDALSKLLECPTTAQAISATGYRDQAIAAIEYAQRSEIAPTNLLEHWNADNLDSMTLNEARNVVRAYFRLFDGDACKDSPAWAWYPYSHAIELLHAEVNSERS